MRKFLLAILFLSVVVSCASVQEDIVSEEEEIVSEKFVVSRIIDGDTLELNTGEKVRLICIDTPERGEEYYEEASDRLSELVLNKEVSLEKDVSEADRYDRLLRYIYVDDVFVNDVLVREGLAKAYRYQPDTSKCDEIEVSEAQAKEEELKLWEIILEPVPTTTESQTTSSTEYVCDSNFYNCGDFKTQKEAQAVFDSCGSGDIHKLDRDDDGIVCESLS